MQQVDCFSRGGFAWAAAEYYLPFRPSCEDTQPVVISQGAVELHDLLHPGACCQVEVRLVLKFVHPSCKNDTSLLFSHSVCVHSSGRLSVQMVLPPFLANHYCGKEAQVLAVDSIGELYVPARLLYGYSASFVAGSPHVATCLIGAPALQVLDSGHL